MADIWWNLEHSQLTIWYTLYLYVFIWVKSMYYSLWAFVVIIPPCPLLLLGWRYIMYAMSKTPTTFSAYFRCFFCQRAWVTVNYIAVFVYTKNEWLVWTALCWLGNFLQYSIDSLATNIISGKLDAPQTRGWMWCLPKLRWLMYIYELWESRMWIFNKSFPEMEAIMLRKTDRK